MMLPMRALHDMIAWQQGQPNVVECILIEGQAEGAKYGPFFNLSCIKVLFACLFFFKNEKEQINIWHGIRARAAGILSVEHHDDHLAFINCVHKYPIKRFSNTSTTRG